MKRLQVSIILISIIILGSIFYWVNKDNHIDIKQEEKTVFSPTQIKNIEAIRQWEFLSITDEEIIDTTRHSFWGDNDLVRIYYGTLRLGIDMNDAKEGWIQVKEDSMICSLPPIKLLDNNFIDEAKTRSFYETGKWTGQDRQDMYDRAYSAMKKRCLSANNISKAEDNAITQFYRMLKAMGFSNVKVSIDKGNQ